MADTDNPNTFCDGEDGCGLKFVNKTSAGLCARCRMVKQDEDRGDHDHANLIMTYPQCEDCGAYGKMFQDHLCGRCRTIRQKQEMADMGPADSQAEPCRLNASRSMPPPPQVPIIRPPPQPAAFRPRSSAVQPPPPSPAVPVNRAGTTRALVIMIEPRFSTNVKELATKLGTVIKTWKADDLLEDAVTDALEYWNRSQWNKISQCSLARDDVALRWNGNHVPERDSEHGTVADFYDIHHSLTHREIFFGKTPVSFKHMKGQWMQLELFIDVEAFEQRTGVSAPDEAKSAASRKCSATSQLASGEPPKKPRTNIPMVSLFRPGTSLTHTSTTNLGYPGNSVHRYTQLEDVQLQLAKISIDAETGEISIVWDSEDAVVAPARIADTVESMGKTKKVFLAELDGGKPFVAKRFFEIGHGSEKVSCKENSDLLQLEAQRLVLGKYFFDLFFERARGLDAEVCDDFAFTSCHLAREIVGSNGPSKASGISSDAWCSLTAEESEPDSTIMWLLEPRRSKSVTRWSGTLTHSTRTDKRHSTMGAFVHFAYEWSQRTIVFADLQSSAGKLPGPHLQYGNILFDVMTHTPEGESGVGDHGVDGILSFLKGHSCNKACEDLQLAATDIAAFRRHLKDSRSARTQDNLAQNDDSIEEETEVINDGNENNKGAESE